MATQQKKVLRKRLVLWGVPSLVVLAVIVMALLPESVPADLAPVVRGVLLVTVDEEGETRVRDRFVISAPVPGQLLRIALEPGDEVVAGETVLASFQPTTPIPLDARSRAEAQAQVKAAEAALGSAQANDERADAELRYAESVLARNRKLAEEKIVSSEQLDEAELELDRTGSVTRFLQLGFRESRELAGEPASILA